MKRGKGQGLLAAIFFPGVVRRLQRRALARADQAQNEQEQMTGSVAADIHDLKARLAQQAMQLIARL